MRVLWLPALGLCVVAALIIVDPVALARLGYGCAIGGCGVPAPWLGGAAASVALAWTLRGLLRRRRPAKPVRRKPVARRGGTARKPAAPAKLRARARTVKRPR